MINKTLLSRLLISSCLIVTSAVAQANEESQLTDFTTDGCSMFPDGTNEQPTLWRHCCVVHDFSYWQGGTYQQRKLADKALRLCLAEVDLPSLGSMMEIGVRLGGSPYFPTSFRWGYGWPYMRGYKALTEQELVKVAEKAPSNLKDY